MARTDAAGWDRPSREDPRTARASAPRDRALPGLSPPRLVGRNEELATLCRTLAGRPALVLVTGEAGIGKSRLVQEFLAAPAGRRQRTLVAACPPFREPATLGPLVDALRQTVDDVTTLRLTPLAGTLRPLLPEWSDALPPDPEPLADATAARFRLFRALAELLEKLRVAVLVLEDAHWADEVTLEFLLFLAGRRPPRVSLLITYRDEEAQAGSTMRRLSSRLASSVAAVRLSLTALPVAQTADLVSSMLAGAEVSAGFAAYLHQRTDGVPLAVEESVQLLYDRADLIWRDGGWSRRHLVDLDVPPTFRDAVLERVARLGTDAQLVLRAAAVLALPTAEAVLAAVAGTEPERFRVGLISALGGGLLKEDRPGRLRFRHSLAAQAVYEAVPAPERRELHQRAGQVLSGAPGNTPGNRASVAQLARHYREAGDAANWSLYAEEAADLALASGDEASAGELLHELIISAALPAASVARLTSKIPFVSFSGEARLRALADTLRATLAAGVSGARTEAEVRLELGRVLHFMEEYGPAMEELARAVPKLASDPLAAARWLGLLSWPDGSTWPAAVHRRWLRRAAAATAAVEASGVPIPAEERLRLRGDRVCVLLQLGDEQGWAEAAEIPDEASTPGETRRLVACHFNLGEAATLWGRYHESARRLALALRLAKRHQYLRLEGMIMVAQARLDWFTGAWAGLLERVTELAEDTGIQPVTRLEAAMIVGLLHAAAGDRAQATARLQHVYERTRRHVATSQATEAAAALARVRLAEGDVAGALTVTREPAAIVAGKGTWLWGTNLAPVRVGALAAAGRVDEAADLAQMLARGARGRNAPAQAAALATCRAILAEQQVTAGGPARAAARFARAAAGWEALPRRYDALLARERQAHCLLAAGQRSAGLKTFELALAGLAELGAAGDAERVTRSMRAHGAAPPPAWRGGRRGYGDQVSPRELDVVRLVLTGRTNREIASELCRSPKTVATQLQSAMRKLGVTSRTTLAVRALEAGLAGGGVAAGAAPSKA